MIILFAQLAGEQAVSVRAVGSVPITLYVCLLRCLLCKPSDITGRHQFDPCIFLICSVPCIFHICLVAGDQPAFTINSAFMIETAAKFH